MSNGIWDLFWEWENILHIGQIRSVHDLDIPGQIYPPSVYMICIAHVARWELYDL